MLVALPVHARPISYPEGWMLMQMNDADMHGINLQYTFTPHFSLGYVGEYWRDADWQFHGAQFNVLLKRLNMPASQANFYLKNAAGLAYSDNGRFDDEIAPAAFTGFAADWEDRRFFTMYENHLVSAGDIDAFFMQKARVGIAPYIGDYGDLHTWLMLEVQHSPENDDNLVITPLVRLFKDVYLIEAGVSEKGDILFNATIQF